MPKSRTPLTLGWEAARANAVPALIIQAIMLALLIAYYTNHSVFSALNQLANYKNAHGLTFVIVASVTAGAIIPEIFLIFSFNADGQIRGTFAICFLRFRFGDLMGHWSIFCIEAKQPGSATS